MNHFHSDICSQILILCMKWTMESIFRWVFWPLQQRFPPLIWTKKNLEPNHLFEFDCFGMSMAAEAEKNAHDYCTVRFTRPERLVCVCRRSGICSEVRLQNIDIKRNYRMLISYAVNYTLKLSDKHSLFSHLIYLIVLIILCCVVLQ